MIDHQINEEMIFRDKISDEAVEAAAFVALGGLPIPIYATYSFACPAKLQTQSVAKPAAGGKMNDQIKLTVDTRDWSSESWLCVDCGFNTAPGFLSRVERQKAFKANGRRIQETIDSNSEVYTVRDSVWQRTGLEPGGGCLCIGCLEKRLGRRLKSEDFDHYDPYNDPSLPGTRRLLERRCKPKGR